MKNLKSNIMVSAIMSVAALFATTTHANNDKLQQAYKSTNVKAAITNVCKEEFGKGTGLSTADISKYCTCSIKIQGTITNEQEWEIRSAINQKKNPATLAFVEKQNQDLEACFGPQLTNKLKTLASKKP